MKVLLKTLYLFAITTLLCSCSSKYHYLPKVDKKEKDKTYFTKDIYNFKLESKDYQNEKGYWSAIDMTVWTDEQPSRIKIKDANFNLNNGDKDIKFLGFYKYDEKELCKTINELPTYYDTKSEEEGSVLNANKISFKTRFEGEKIRHDNLKLRYNIELEDGRIFNNEIELDLSKKTKSHVGKVIGTTLVTTGLVLYIIGSVASDDGNIEDDYEEEYYD